MKSQLAKMRYYFALIGMALSAWALCLFVRRMAVFLHGVSTRLWKLHLSNASNLLRRETAQLLDQ